MVHDDYERDFLKEAMFIHECTIDLEKQIEELAQDLNRVAAKLIVIKEETLQHDGKTRSELLPF